GFGEIFKSGPEPTELGLSQAAEVEDEGVRRFVEALQELDGLVQVLEGVRRLPQLKEHLPFVDERFPLKDSRRSIFWIRLKRSSKLDLCLSKQVSLFILRGGRPPEGQGVIGFLYMPRCGR